MKRWNLTKKQTALFALPSACGLFVIACVLELVWWRVSFPAYVFLLVLAFVFVAVALAGGVIFLLKFPKCASQIVAIIMCVITLLSCAIQIKVQIILWYNVMPYRTLE